MARGSNRRGPWTPIAERVEKNLDRHVQDLRGLVAASNLSEAEIEARLDWPPNRLRRLFSHPRELKYGDVFAILAAIGVEPRHYFDLVASPETEH